MIRVAVIGMGLMGGLHARIYHDMDDVELVACVEVDADRRAQVEAELGVRCVERYDDVPGDVDAVSITLPDDLHVQASIDTIIDNRYALIEKPLASTVAECEQILAAQRHPGRLMVGQLLRFDLRLAELKRRIDAGALGELHYVRIHRANPLSAARRLRNRVSVTAFLGVHDLDLLLWLTGQDIASVTASGRKIVSDTWDLSVAELELSGGTLASVANHWLIHDASARSCIAGVEVFGSTGTATVDLSTGELDIATDELGRSLRVDTHNWTHDPVVSGGSLRRELAAFVSAARRQAPCPVSGEEGMRAVAAVEAVERALDAH